MFSSRHSHSFTKCQLESIIDSYLSMSPYYKVLLRCLKIATANFEQRSEHNDKPHPIRVYARQHQCSKNLLEEDNQNEGRGGIDIKVTYMTGKMKYYYIYPLEYLIEILQSAEYYSYLPTNIIINGLLTATNLDIIIQTLKIVSEDMCKKIRMTIAGKQLKEPPPSSPSKDEILQEDGSMICVNSAKDNNRLSWGHIPNASIVMIDVEEEEKEKERYSISEAKSMDLLKRQIGGTKNVINVGKDVVDKECRFCQGYLIYLYETVGENPLDDDINRFTAESTRCLNLISTALPHLTLYLKETNQTHLPNDITVLNQVLDSIGLVITQDIFQSELNPKVVKPVDQASPRRPKNLLEELEPYFKTLEKKKNNEQFSVEEVFRMLVYAPTTKEVAQQLKMEKGDQLQKQFSAVKNLQREDKAVRLLEKECRQMRHFEKERLAIAQNLVDTKPIYKQLQCPNQAAKAKAGVRGAIYGADSSSKSTQSKLFNDKIKAVNNFSIVPNTSTSLKAENRPGTATGGQKRLKKKGSKNVKSKGEELNLNGFNHSMAMSTVFKRSAIKNSNTASPFSPMATNSSQPMTFSSQHNNFIQITTSTQVYADNPSRPLQESQEQLSDQAFIRMLAQASHRKQPQQTPYINSPSHLYKIDSSSNYLAVPNTPTSPSHFMTQSLRTKKFANTPGTSLSHFIGRKQEQEQMDCIEKQEKERFNKQLLNGEFIRNQVYQEINKGLAEVYEGYGHTMKLSDTFRMANRTYTAQSNEEDSKLLFMRSPHRKKLHCPGNVIEENSTKYNHTGLIRNQKYNKNIKNQLINHRYSFLKANEKQNESKCRLQSHMRTNSKKSTAAYAEVKERYEEELKAALYDRQFRATLKQNVLETFEDQSGMIIDAFC